MSEADRRVLRVSEAVRNALTDVLNKEIADPSLAGLVITRLEVTRDLSLASVYFRLLGKGTKSATARALGHLERAKGRLRHAVGSRIKLRRVPELRFFYDEGQDAALRIESLLNEIQTSSPDEPK